MAKPKQGALNQIIRAKCEVCTNLSCKGYETFCHLLYDIKSEILECKCTPYMMYTGKLHQMQDRQREPAQVGINTACMESVGMRKRLGLELM